MDNPNRYDDLLARFILNELNPDEEKEVIEWLYASEENVQYFEQFKELMNLSKTATFLQNVDVNDEWDYHRRVVTGGEMIMNVPEETGDFPFDARIRRRKRINLMLMSAMAASFVLVILAVLYVSGPKKSSSRSVTENTITSHGEGKNVPDNVITEKNISNVPRSLLLSDGSEVVLYANSELIYEKNFTGNERRLQLKGKADFAVTKDSAKPFIVATGHISTTVLGTRFTITAYDESVIARVKLHEGKVIVKSIAGSTKQLKNDYLLAPGQELVYNKLNGEAFVRWFKKAAIAKSDDVVEDINMPENFSGSWFMFNNQPLPDVLDQLQAIYNVEITYTKTDLDKMYFIGRFDQTDSIHNILQKISLLYQLKVSNNNNKYSITR